MDSTTTTSSTIPQPSLTKTTSLRSSKRTTTTPTTASATSGTTVSILHYRSRQPQLQPQVVLRSVSFIIAHANHSFSHKWYYGQYPSLSLANHSFSHKWYYSQHYCSHQPQLQPQVVLRSVSIIIAHTNHSFSHKWYYGQYPHTNHSFSHKWYYYRISFSHKWYYGQYPSLSLTASATSGTTVSILHYCSHQPPLQPQVVLRSVSFIIAHTNHSFSHKWYYGQYPSLSLTPTTASATSGTTVSIRHYNL